VIGPELTNEHRTLHLFGIQLNRSMNYPEDGPEHLLFPLFFVAFKPHPVKGAFPVLQILDGLLKPLFFLPRIQDSMISCIDLGEFDEVIPSNFLIRLAERLDLRRCFAFVIEDYSSPPAESISSLHCLLKKEK
jgi:hypothetical protein